MSNQIDLQRHRAEQIAAMTGRLNRLPPSGYLWRLVMLLSLCGFFEIYEIALTAFLSPGLVRDGVFNAGAKGLFGLADQASFAAATFAGLFVGAALFSSVADKYGRRTVLTYSLLWYAVSTVVMAAQSTAPSVDLWRLIAGIGVGVQLVTIDSYLAELVPKGIRGKAFAFSYGLMYLAVPTAALLCWLMLPNDPPLMAGWRWVALLAALAVPAVLWVRRVMPESPRWLLQRGQLEAAEKVLAEIEARVSSDLHGQLPPPQIAAPEMEGKADLAELLRPTYRRRTLMLVALNIFQALGFYGFSNWVPALLASQGIAFVKSLEYSFAIAIVYPLAPLLIALFADRFEAKWQIVAGAFGTAVFGLAFARQSSPAMLIAFGALITVSNILLSYSYHAYQTTLYPTRIRARAVGFVYSFSRLATVLSGFAIAIVLRDFGTTGVFTFIALCMLVVVIAVGAFGPQTRGLTLEQSSQ
jgi:MFS transporter, putative metabolite:H+ symporter